MDHGYLLTLSIHLAEIATSPQNFADTSGIILWYDLRLWLSDLITDPIRVYPMTATKNDQNSDAVSRCFLDKYQGWF